MKTLKTTKLLSGVMQILEAKFGLINDALTNNKIRGVRYQFFDTAEPRIKVCVYHGYNHIGEATSIGILVAVEEKDRKGMFFDLGDRLHFDLKKFPEFQFHADIREKLSATSAHTESGGDVLAFATELTKKL